MTIAIESTLDEIVDIPTLTADGPGDRTCLREAAWSVELPHQFKSDHATWTGVSFSKIAIDQLMCVLRAAGADFDVDAFLATSSLEACATFEKGQLRFLTKPDGKRRDRSGFNADVSTKEWSDRTDRSRTRGHSCPLTKMSCDACGAFPGVELVELDFPIYLRIGTNDVAVQSDGSGGLAAGGGKPGYRHRGDRLARRWPVGRRHAILNRAMNRSRGVSGFFGPRPRRPPR